MQDIEFKERGETLDDIRFFIDEDGDLNVVLDNQMVVCIQKGYNHAWVRDSDIKKHMTIPGRISYVFKPGDKFTITV